MNAEENAGAGYEPPQTAIRLSIEANRGTPAIASLLAKLLTDAGATVTFGDSRIERVNARTNLTGLKVHIDRLTWVRHEEAERWFEPNVTHASSLATVNLGGAETRVSSVVG